MNRREFIKSSLAVAAAIPYGLGLRSRDTIDFENLDPKLGNAARPVYSEDFIVFPAGERINAGSAVVIGPDGKAYAYRGRENEIVVGTSDWYSETYTWTDRENFRRSNPRVGVTGYSE